MPMLKKYPKVAPAAESKIGPSINALKFVINYSKAIEAKKIGKQKMLFQLN
jgi:hypothetical protein